jgi:hypothetical protein
MNYAEQDQVAAIGDLLAFDGELIEVSGQKMRAHIELGTVSKDASMHGLDNREQEITATIINRGAMPNPGDQLIRRNQRFRITEVSPAGNQVSVLTAVND